MKKYFVIGNPIDHSLSPKLHNYWLKENNIDAIYDKKKIEEKDLQTTILEIKEKKTDGINVTVPFKKSVIPYLDKLSPEAEQTQSVNTIVLTDDNLVGSDASESIAEVEDIEIEDAIDDDTISLEDSESNVQVISDDVDDLDISEGSAENIEEQ